MNIQLKPGLWKTRDGRKAVVEYRTACPGAQYPWIGYIGKRVMSWSDGGMEFLHEKGGADLISPWTKPKLRPWKLEEVPVGALFRHNNRGATHCWMIVGYNAACFFISNGAKPVIGFADAVDDGCIHSLDGGKTWLPCGVMEGEA